MDARKQEIYHNSLAGKIQDLSFQAMGKLSATADGVAQSVQQGKALLESSAQTVQTNLRVFQLIHDIQLFILRIPGQVQRQQPKTNPMIPLLELLPAVGAKTCRAGWIGFIHVLTRTDLKGIF